MTLGVVVFALALGAALSTILGARRGHGRYALYGAVLYAVCAVLAAFVGDLDGVIVCVLVALLCGTLAWVDWLEQRR